MKRLLFILTATLLTTLQLRSQPPRKLTQTPGYELRLNTQSTIILPPDYDAAKKYPLVIFLPFTGGSSSDFFEQYAIQCSDGLAAAQSIDLSKLLDSLKRAPSQKEMEDYLGRMMAPKPADSTTRGQQLAKMLERLFDSQAREKSFLIMLPPGSGSSKDHSWQGFEACIYRYENRILTDIGTCRKQYNIDPNSIVLTGFSLGGDLGWAISQRYPEVFAGAIISGSSCSYSEKDRMTRQARRGVRYYMAMGQSDAPRRVNGMNAARLQLEKAGVRCKYSYIIGGHIPATMEQLQEGLNYVLFRQ
jgi:pimeloyl-ACP methyl ester carboxylesterase